MHRLASRSAFRAKTSRGTLGLAGVSILLLFVLATLAGCGGGSAGTPAATLTAITTQPADQNVVAGTTATFAVAATDATGYQWHTSSDGGTTFANLAGATSASYTTPTTALADSGTVSRRRQRCSQQPDQLRLDGHEPTRHHGWRSVRLRPRSGRRTERSGDQHRTHRRGARALIYKLYAEFGDARLPAQYAGDDTGFIEGDAQHQVLAYIANTGIGNVSAATLDTLRPFFVPAHYEGSWWHKQNAGAPSAVAERALRIAAGAATAAASNPNCRAWETECSTLAEWKNRGLIAQAAHEFMHAIQFSINVVAPCLENYYTTQEATAVWATQHVYPKNDWEHTYAKSYLRGNWVSESYDWRPPKPSLFRYGAYVLPLFLETRFGPGIVKSIWDQTTTFNQELFAIDGAIKAAGSSFLKEWPKFVAANWNRDTIKTYFDADILAENGDLNGDETFAMTAGGTTSLTHAVSLKHASAGYYRVVFGDSASRSVAIVNGLSFEADSLDLTGFGNNFAFTGLDALARQGASMQVFLKVNGAWQSGPANLRPRAVVHRVPRRPRGKNRRNDLHVCQCGDQPVGPQLHGARATCQGAGAAGQQRRLPRLERESFDERLAARRRRDTHAERHHLEEPTTDGGAVAG